LIALFTGTHLIAISRGNAPTGSWMPWSGDVILVAAGLLILGLGFLIPLHAGLMNVAIHAQFLIGFVAGSLITRNEALLPGASAGLALLAGAAAGAGAGVVVAWLKRRFAIHEILSGLLLGAALVPLARALRVAPVTPPALTIELGPLAGTLPWAPALKLPPSFVLTWGILLLTLGLMLAFLAAHLLRTSVRGFELRAVGANPLAAVAAGVDVDAVQTLTIGLGGACAGVTGALQLWTNPAVALERWPLPLGFAGLTVALLGGGYLGGAIVAALVLAIWLNTPGVPAALEHPAWGGMMALLLVLPVLWNLPRLLPDQGAPRSIWRTRHREPL
jgi:general nucleoside transport system permease protein